MNAILARYEVTTKQARGIRPSIENDALYGEIEHDEQMDLLMESIERQGLEEPIIVSEDNYIISGHRRFYACKRLGIYSIPCRVKKGVFREGHPDWHRLLMEYNPQRIKSAAVLLREGMLRFGQQDSSELLKTYESRPVEAARSFTDVKGLKEVKPVSKAQKEFLDAASKVVYEFREFWPVSLRFIHYKMLNDPPLMQKYKRSKVDPELHRYRNDDDCYNKLSKLLTSARYYGHIPFEAMHDETRPEFWHPGYRNPSEFIQSEIDNFLRGYHQDLQADQPRHIVVLAEKLTLSPIVRPVCEPLHVQLQFGKGYGSTSQWYAMAKRFRDSGKKRMTLIVLSDYDPEGLHLADDAVRTLRDLWEIPIDLYRVGVNREQIDELKLSEDFNPAKVKSSRLKEFIKKTGGTETWEIEALPPDYIQRELESAILANMDQQILQMNRQQVATAAREIQEFRQQIIDALKM